MTAFASLVEANTKRLHGLADGVVARLESLAPANPSLAPAIDAEKKTMTTHRGQTLTYYVDRGGRETHGQRPLVLLHSLNAAASSYEVRPLFEKYRGTRPVYALDLPGFGLSGREDRPYTIDLYVDSIRELLARVKDVDGEADVVALSLTGELAARAAIARKDLFHSLAFLSPTGFDAGARKKSPFERFDKIVREPLVSRLLFEVIASRPSIRYFLDKAFVGKPDAGLLDYGYATSHQPGAYHAPIAFITGDLFTDDVRSAVYAQLAVPALVVHDADPFTRFDALPAFVSGHPGWHAERVVPSRGMPQFEQLAALAKTLEDFWHRSAHPH